MSEASDIKQLEDLRNTQPHLTALLKVTLDEFEERMRHYLNKVEVDRPWVAEAIWEAVFRFRQRSFTAYYTMEQEISEAKRRRDTP